MVTFSTLINCTKVDDISKKTLNRKDKLVNLFLTVLVRCSVSLAEVWMNRNRPQQWEMQINNVLRLYC